MFQLTQEVRLIADATSADQHAPPRPASNQEAAEVLFNIATLLQMQNANPYRIEAYRNAARNLLLLPEPVAAILARNAVLHMPGLGARLRRKITELVTTGRMTFYDDLCEESLPEDVRALMRVRYVGPRTALRLADHLDIHSVEQLWRAADARQLRQHHGFGARSERRLADAARAALVGEAHAA
ncbi:MAG TPA: helix-hairpin-helix domain-containing protein [Ktedonobacterales bacterium]|nr:helix-hairpin-helix domain-containing protein [Ktedonobacterales bacterium]